MTRPICFGELTATYILSVYYFKHHLFAVSVFDIATWTIHFGL